MWKVRYEPFKGPFVVNIVLFAALDLGGTPRQADNRKPDESGPTCWLCKAIAGSHQVNQR